MAIIYSSAVPTASEMEGSPTEQWTDQGLTATARLTVPWALRHTLVSDLLTEARQYPHITTAVLRAVSASIVPHSKRTIVAEGDQGNNYESAEVSVNYGTLEINDPGGSSAIQIFSEEMSPNGEFMTVDPKHFQWGASGRKLTKEEAPGRLMLSVDYVQTQYQMPSLIQALIDLTNHVNSATITSTMLGFTFPPQTLLYAGCTPQKTTNSIGAATWTVPKRFCYRKDGWNKFWHAGTNTYQQIYTTEVNPFGEPYLNFPPADFSPILI